MSVTKFMSTPVEHCTPETDLAAAAMVMWRTDCGIVPVVESGTNRLVGVITDRDICMAAGTKHQAPCCISVADVMARTVVACRPVDSLQSALARMAENRVRRLPVVDAEGQLVGMLSIADLIHAVASTDHTSEVRATDVLSALAAICHRTGAEDEALSPRANPAKRTGPPATAGHRGART